MMASMTREEMFQAAGEEHEKFKLAVGDLILAFADLEVNLFGLLRFYGNISEPVGHAIFSGARASAMIGYIRAIAHNTKLDPVRAADLDEVFSQIQAINTMRDMIVHHVSGSIHEFDDNDPSTRFVTDARRVSRFGNAKRIKIGSAQVRNMKEDVLTCCWRLIAHTDRRNNNPFKPGPNPDGKLHAWLYRPLQPSKKNQRSGQSDRKRQRPRPPSRG